MINLMHYFIYFLYLVVLYSNREKDKGHYIFPPARRCNYKQPLSSLLRLTVLNGPPGSQQQL